jgi:hypothetical protein
MYDTLCVLLCRCLLMTLVLRNALAVTLPVGTICVSLLLHPTPAPTSPPPAPTDAPTDTDIKVPVCFSAETTVQVAGKGIVAMKDLQV